MMRANYEGAVLLLTMTQASEMKISSVLTHVLFVPKLDWYLPNP